ncbi:MAG: beta-N-acetylhexosaminidase [Clostridiales bacterium]|nr:beta-N-acetylhexosaminidase [Clostridiales bacterium]
MSNKKSDFGKIKMSDNNLSENAVKDFTGFLGFDENDKPNLLFEEDGSVKKEGYRIVVKNGIITVYSSEPSGAFYALQTLKQILYQGKMILPEIEINDFPAYPYRGFMLDVGRYFYSVADVKIFIDRMALHKLNVFHFHLTEDQGWRIEIKKYPLLTQIGSRRSHTNFNNIPYGGFYTQEEIKEIVDYCHSKYIKVMPEFDIPGHSRAAIAAYSYLSCFPRELPVATHWGVKKDVLCAGKESTYKFVFDVLDEFCELFTDGLFHIGGDEVPKHRWRLCSDCQRKIKEENLADETELQEYFMNRVYNYLSKRGYQVYMWNYDKLNPKILDENIGFSLCSGEPGKRRCVDTFSHAYYLDLPYGYTSLENTCNHKIKGETGAEVQVWTEYIPNMKKADSLIYPRMGAMCETVWKGENNYKDFLKKLPAYYSLLDKMKISYSTGESKMTPKGIRKKLSIIYFEKRQLDWEGLNILIDDKIIEKRAKAENK